MNPHRGGAIPWIVAGGINMDILAKPAGAFRPGDSNPGSIMERPGGVGYNIARNLAGFGNQVLFLTALGGDSAGTALVRHAEERGLDLSWALIKESHATSRYLAVHDGEGDMVAAINDMNIFDTMTADEIAPWTRLGRRELCRGAVLDPNLPAPVLESLALAFTVRLYADAVSIAKIDRLSGVLPRLHGLKVNRLEAEHLTRVSIQKTEDAALAADKLCQKGIRYVCISLGTDGALFADGSAFVLGQPAGIIHDGNATGAGDAMAAAFAWAANEAFSLEDIARYGVAAATLAVESDEAVNPALSYDLLLQRSEKVKIEVIK